MDDPAELKKLLVLLDEVRRQAQDLERQINRQMAEQARRDYPATDARDVERPPKRRGSPN